jgi:hypothetical protein
VLAFSAAYGDFLSRLTESFGGHPELLLPAVADMFRIKELACQIMRNPMPGRVGVNAAPIFRGLDPVQLDPFVLVPADFVPVEVS